MQKIASIHDWTPQGWDNLYLALHTSTRLGADLQVLTLPVDEQDQSPAHLTEQILTAGNAAGIAVQTRALPSFTSPAILESVGDVSALLIPAGLLKDTDLLSNLALGLSCPVWVVSGLVEIRRLAALLDPPGEVTASRYATSLAGRLEASLLFLTKEASSIPEPDPELHTSTLESFSPEALRRQVELEHIDLLIFPSARVHQLQDCASLLSCLLALCPPSDGETLN